MNIFLQNQRTKYNYTQDELAKLIGISRQTFAKIEAGEAELTVSQALKLADVFKLSLEDFLAGKEIPEAKLIVEKGKKTVLKSAKPTLRISIPQKNIKKFKEVLLYILEKIGAKPNVGEGVICKLLYFIDFDYYEKYEEQLMGAVYIKNHHGPTPAGFPEILKEMEAQSEITPVSEKYFKFQQKKYLPIRKANLTLLSAQEVEHIDWVLARLSDKNAKEMEEYSHRDVPFIIAKNLTPLKYEAVFYRTPEFSVREYSDEV